MRTGNKLIARNLLHVYRLLKTSVTNCCKAFSFIHSFILFARWM